MDNEKYIAPSKLTKQFDITSGTLRNWAEAGKIRYLRPNNRRRIYNVEDVIKIFGITPKEVQKKTVIYARVSSSHQKEDLERQIELLKASYPEAHLIKDVGSGLNWNRHGFNSLLELVYKGDVSTVVVTYKDRICRFGFELVDWIFKKASVKLVVLGADTITEDASRELSDDLLAITTVFVAKNNGIRAGQLRKLRIVKEREEGSSKEKEVGENDSK